jgi:hypothetical protein
MVMQWKVFVVAVIRNITIRFEERRFNVNRAERKRAEREIRIVGWAQHPSPKQLGIGTGWFGELDKVYRQGNDYVVMIRNIETEWGKVQHACIRNADNSDIPWREKQRIKNEIFGKESLAIEVFPCESQLVDEAGMYHIWVLPTGFKIPFGLKD